MIADININLSRIAEYGGVILTISGCFALIWRPIKKILSRYDDAIVQAEKQIDKHAEMLAEQERINEEQDCNAESIMRALEPLSQGVQQILRFRLQRECDRIIRRGSITTKEYEDIYRIHEVYEDLGQNGLISSVYREAISQPRKDN